MIAFNILLFIVVVISFILIVLVLIKDLGETRKKIEKREKSNNSVVQEEGNIYDIKQYRHNRQHNKKHH